MDTQIITAGMRRTLVFSAFLVVIGTIAMIYCFWKMLNAVKKHDYTKEGLKRNALIMWACLAVIQGFVLITMWSMKYATYKKLFKWIFWAWFMFYNVYQQYSKMCLYADTLHWYKVKRRT